MRCIRAQNPTVLRLLDPLLLDDPDYNKNFFLQQLFVGLRANLPELCVLIVFDDAETEIVGYTILEAMPGQNFVWCYQSWAHPVKGGSRCSNLMWARAMEYTRHMGRGALRAETKRNTKVFERMRDTRIVAQIIEYKVNDTAFELFINSQENSDGRQFSNERSESTTKGLSVPVEELSSSATIGERSENPDRNEDSSSIQGSASGLRISGNGGESVAEHGNENPSSPDADQLQRPDVGSRGEEPEGSGLLTRNGSGDASSGSESNGEAESELQEPERKSAERRERQLGD